MTISRRSILHSLVAISAWVLLKPVATRAATKGQRLPKQPCPATPTTQPLLRGPDVTEKELESAIVILFEGPWLFMPDAKEGTMHVLAAGPTRSCDEHQYRYGVWDVANDAQPHCNLHPGKGHHIKIFPPKPRINRFTTVFHSAFSRDPFTYIEQVGGSGGRLIPQPSKAYVAFRLPVPDCVGLLAALYSNSITNNATEFNHGGKSTGPIPLTFALVYKNAAGLTLDGRVITAAIPAVPVYFTILHEDGLCADEVDPHLHQQRAFTALAGLVVDQHTSRPVDISVTPRVCDEYATANFLGLSRAQLGIGEQLDFGEQVMTPRLHIKHRLASCAGGGFVLGARDLPR